MKYTEDHEWLRVEGDVVVVGITEHASTQLGDVVFVEPKAVVCWSPRSIPSGCARCTKCVARWMRWQLSWRRSTAR